MGNLINISGRALGINTPIKVLELLSWRLATEIYRRYPHRFLLIETHPSGGLNDCLTLWNIQIEESEIEINRQGSVHVHPDHIGFCEDWVDKMIGGDCQRLLDAISDVLQLQIPKQVPSSTPATITFRFIAEFLTHSFGRLEKWECRNGFDDSSGGRGGKREELFSVFPNIKILSNAKIPRPFKQAYYFWFLIKDGVPKFCLDTEGRLFRPDGQTFYLAEIYKKEKRIWPLVAQVAMLELP